MQYIDMACLHTIEISTFEIQTDEILCIEDLVLEQSHGLRSHELYIDICEACILLWFHLVYVANNQ